MANIELDGANKTLKVDSGDLTLDIPGDIILDADGGDVFVKDAGTTFGSLTNTSGNLIIKSGTTTAATFSGANVTLAGTVASGAITSSGIVKTDDATDATSTTDGSLQTDGGLSVVKDVVLGDDLKLLSDSSVIAFGADGDTTLTHTDGTGLTLNSTNKLCFNDATQFIQGSSGTVLSIGATDEIDLTATAVDLNGTLNVSGVATFQAAPVFPDGSIAVADLDIDGATDIGADIVDADLFVIDDGAGGTNRKTTAARVKTYIGGGGLVKLASSKSSDDTGAVTLDGFTSATYDNYRVIGLFVPATDNVDFLFRAVNASGVYSTSNAYSWNYDARRTDNSGSADYTNAAHADTKWKFGDNVNRDAGSDYMALDITLYEWRTNDTSRLMWQGNMINNQNANAGFHQGHGGGKLTSNIDATGISFFFSSGDIDHHSVSVFGVSK